MDVITQKCHRWCCRLINRTDRFCVDVNHPSPHAAVTGHHYKGDGLKLVCYDRESILGPWYHRVDNPQL